MLNIASCNSLVVLKCKFVNVTQPHSSLAGNLEHVAMCVVFAGNEDKMQVTVQYVHKYSIPLLGVYNVPLHKYIRCSSFEVFNSVITRLNRHLHEMAQRTQSMTRNFDFELPSIAHLSIMDAADNIP